MARGGEQTAVESTLPMSFHDAFLFLFLGDATLEESNYYFHNKFIHFQQSFIRGLVVNNINDDNDFSFIRRWTEYRICSEKLQAARSTFIINSSRGVVFVSGVSVASISNIHS